MRLGQAFRTFFRVLSDANFAQRVAAASVAFPPAKAKDDLRVLGLLQRDGRLIDFLTEDVSAYSDEQIGAAVRDIHRDCRKCLEKYFVFEPVVPQSEDEGIVLEAGFDPVAIRLTGAVKGTAPYRGTVVHRGYRVKESKMPPLAVDSDTWLVAPAEVEVA